MTETMGEAIYHMLKAVNLRMQAKPDESKAAEEWAEKCYQAARGKTPVAQPIRDGWNYL